MKNKTNQNLQAGASEANAGSKANGLKPSKSTRECIKLSRRYAPIILMAGITAKGEDKEENAPSAKRLTQKEKAEIMADTKAKRVALLTLPPSPFESIIPAPGISGMNALAVCGYVSDKFPRILAITEFADCSPTVTFVQGIYDALYPLSTISSRKISPSDLSTRNTLTKQLKQNFLLLMNSCAILANGDMALFLLTGVAAKRKAVKHNDPLPAPNVKLSFSKGRGKIGVSCAKIPYAKNYTVMWGVGEYDRTKWNSQNGSSRQVITSAALGEAINIIMVANGKNGPGEFSNPVGANVPFN